MQSRRKAHVRGQAAKQRESWYFTGAVLSVVLLMFVRALDSSLWCKQKLDLHGAFLSSALLLSFPSLLY